MTPTACFSFDNMAEAAEIGAGTLDAARPRGTDPSLAIGYPRLLALLERCALRATFFLEGWNGVHHPDAVAEVVRCGHELGMHGWTHETWSALEPERERELAVRATDALERASGTRPRGFRAPGGVRTAATESILTALGYDHDASLGDRMRPSRLPGGLAQVPFVWPGVDGFHYLRPEPAAPEQVRDAWLASLERVAERGGLFLIVSHAFVSAIDEARLAALEVVIRAATSDRRIAVRTVGEVAAAIGPG